MNQQQPIITLHLFAPLEVKLTELLKSLSAEEWQKMALPLWTVKDVAAHLLDSALRRLSMVRDGYYGEKFTGSSPDDFVQFLNGLNSEWVRAFQRVSPPLLISMLENASQELIAYLHTLDPNEPAGFAVSWAGEEDSANWFDIAREYTERWHHQQQIRDVTNRQDIMSSDLYAPVLETFMRSLPHVYRQVESPAGTTLQIEITGTAGGIWFLTRTGKWQLTRDTQSPVAAKAVIPGNIAWKLFTKGLDRQQFESQVRLEGNFELASVLSSALAIVG